MRSQSKEKIQIIEVNVIMKLVIALFFSIFNSFCVIMQLNWRKKSWVFATRSRYLLDEL